jgi:hypothetical protein
MRRFPRVEARNLEGRNLVLPDELDGDVSCVVVAFHRQHQRLVDTWLPHLEQLATEHPGFRYYEMPTISARWRPARGFIDGGMATAIADRAARERTVTVYGDVRSVVTALDLPNTDDIAVVVVARDGEIVWQAAGPHDDAALVELRAAVAGAAN